MGMEQLSVKVDEVRFSNILGLLESHGYGSCNLIRAADYWSWFNSWFMGVDVISCEDECGEKFVVRHSNKPLPKMQLRREEMVVRTLVKSWFRDDVNGYGLQTPRKVVTLENNGHLAILTPYIDGESGESLVHATSDQQLVNIVVTAIQGLADMHHQLSLDHKRRLRMDADKIDAVIYGDRLRKLCFLPRMTG